MNFEEFLEKARTRDGWKLDRFGQLRNNDYNCPLQAVFGLTGYRTAGAKAGLKARHIIAAADGYTNGKYRKALLALVQP